MLEATLLALGSAALHAFWNLLVKTSDERFLTAWGQFALGGVLALPVLLFTGLPDADVVPYLLATTVVHVLYIGALVQAYHHGDFSLAYPLARGGGALIAAVGGVVFLSDTLSAGAWLGIAIVVGGLASLARAVGRPRRAALGGDHRRDDRDLHHDRSPPAPDTPTAAWSTASRCSSTVAIGLLGRRDRDGSAAAPCSRCSPRPSARGSRSAGSRR